MPDTGLDHAVEELLLQSLAAWRVSGDVSREADGSLLVAAGEKRLRITRAPAELPFRWMVSENERPRGATSISGLLRTVRLAVDPGYNPLRLRIAPLPPPGMAP